MRHFSYVAAAVLAFEVLIPFDASAQGSLRVTNYQLVSETKITRTVSDFAYRADVVNTTGIARPKISAQIFSGAASAMMIQGSLHFANVPTIGLATSTDAFTIRVDRTVPFDLASLTATFRPPENPWADAGPGQLVIQFATVTLNGSASNNPSGFSALAFSWTLASRPPGSSATLINPTSVTPTFVADQPGDYFVVLTVNNGAGSDSASVTISAIANIQGMPDSIVASSGTPQAAFVNAAFHEPLVAIVKDAGGTPLAGVTVTFNVNPSGSGAGGTFPGNATSATAVTNGSGVAMSPVFTANGTGGSYTVTANTNPPVATAATFNLANAPIFTNIAPPGLGNVSIGQNLEAPLTLTLPSPAPTGGVNVFITSLNPSLVLLGGQLAAGTAQVVIPVPEGSTTVVGLYAQSLAASGTVQLSIAASGYGNSTATVTLTPSGFILIGPNGIGQPSFPTSINANVPLAVSAARLDSSLAFAEVQQLRGPSTFSATVSLSTSDTNLGTVTPPAVTINGGDTIANATFHANPSLLGSVVITAATPAGYSTPTPAQGYTQLTANISGARITTIPVTVGQNLEEITQFSFTPAPAFLTFTITSNDPSKLLLSLTPDAAGQASINFDTGMNAGHTNSPPFFVYGLVNSGSATYTVSASGYTPTTGTVNFVPSAFVIIAPFGVGQGFTTTSGAANVDLTIESIRLDTLDPQAVRGGITVNVPVVSSNTSVGTITTSPVVFTGGVAGVNTQFHPLSNGNTTISITTPPGFSTAATGSTVQATVTPPRIIVADGLAVGKGLQSIATLFVNQPAPASGLPVTLTSNSPDLKLSLSPTTAGSSSIVVTIPAGGTSTTYYIQALTDTGSGTHTGSAGGYTSGTGTISFTPSGVVIFGPFGLNSPFPLTTTVAQGPKNFTVATSRLLPGSFATDHDGQQQLAGGSSLSISLANSNASVGTVPSPVTINGGSDSVTPLFTPLSVGQTVISVIKPAAFSQPSDNTTLTVRVNP